MRNVDGKGGPILASLGRSEFPLFNSFCRFMRGGMGGEPRFTFTIIPCLNISELRPPFRSLDLDLDLYFD
jgi:hypothetical protein